MKVWGLKIIFSFRPNQLEINQNQLQNSHFHSMIKFGFLHQKKCGKSVVCHLHSPLRGQTYAIVSDFGLFFSIKQYKFARMLSKNHIVSIISTLVYENYPSKKSELYIYNCFGPIKGILGSKWAILGVFLHIFSGRGPKCQNHISW